MPAEEYEEFQRLLTNALEDLVNARPKEPIKYLAQSLYQSLPIEDQSDHEFPELAQAKPITYQMALNDMVPPANIQYPEGFVASRRRKL